MHKAEQHDLDTVSIRRQNDKAIFQTGKASSFLKWERIKHPINNSHYDTQHYWILTTG